MDTPSPKTSKTSITHPQASHQQSPASSHWIKPGSAPAQADKQRSEMGGTVMPYQGGMFSRRPHQAEGHHSLARSVRNNEGYFR